MKKKKAFVVVNIGCIECGVISNLVGVFSSKEQAESVADVCQESFDWRQGGQNDFKVFELPKIGTIADEYMAAFPDRGEVTE